MQSNEEADQRQKYLQAIETKDDLCFLMAFDDERIMDRRIREDSLMEEPDGKLLQNDAEHFDDKDSADEKQSDRLV